jgi:hypothetical protein
MSVKVILERLKSPVVLFGLVAVLLSAAQISPENLTSWEVLGDNLIAFISNPFLVGTAIVSIYAFFNNPTNKDGF